jgi:hypothetical protein
MCNISKKNLKKKIRKATLTFFKLKIGWKGAVELVLKSLTVDRHPGMSFCASRYMELVWRETKGLEEAVFCASRYKHFFFFFGLFVSGKRKKNN